MTSGCASPLRRFRGQAQADAERPVGREPCPHRGHVLAEVAPHLRPGLAGMDVAAIGEVAGAERRLAALADDHCAASRAPQPADGLQDLLLVHHVHLFSAADLAQQA